MTVLSSGPILLVADGSVRVTRKTVGLLSEAGVVAVGPVVGCWLVVDVGVGTVAVPPQAARKRQEAVIKPQSNVSFEVFPS